MDIIKALNLAGFTGQEALIYITLCQHGELSGYEVAKIAGISRSNAYSALTSLVEKGGAFSIEEKTKKYIATPKKELLHNLKRSFESNMEFLDNHLDFEPLTYEPYITISGTSNILNKVKNMIEFASNRIYISACMEDLDLLKDELEKAVNKGLKVVLICDECADVPHTLSYHAHCEIDSLKIIVDTEEVLTGRLDAKEQSLYSKNKTLVHFIREALINEIELIKIRKGIA